MRPRGRTFARFAAAGLCLLVGVEREVVRADGKPPPDPDMDFIEFLGSVDSDDADWQAWLKDPEQGAPVPQRVSAPPSPPPPPPSAPKPAPKNDEDQDP
jgi:hypothetical protein